MIDYFSTKKKIKKKMEKYILINCVGGDGYSIFPIGRWWNNNIAGIMMIAVNRRISG
jgi:hypothetical protein